MVKSPPEVSMRALLRSIRIPTETLLFLLDKWDHARWSFQALDQHETETEGHIYQLITTWKDQTSLLDVARKIH